MSSETPDAVATETPVASVAITARTILRAMVVGFVGLVLMSPLLLGVPLALGVFQAEPLVEFASIGSFFGVQAGLLGPLFGLSPSVILGGLLFAFGGIIFLPVQFLVVGAFLPPESPRFVRGVSFATLWWFGFLAAFWPGGSLLTVAVFLVVSLLSHWIYGATLGYLVERLDGIPQHEV